MQAAGTTFSRFYQRYVQGFVGQAFVTVAVQLLDRVVQFSGEFYTVAPPPTIAMFTLPFAPVGGVFQEEIQHLLVKATRPVRVIEEMQFSLTPGVLNR